MRTEKVTPKLLRFVKEIIDSVYDYLIPHPDGITMSAKDYGKKGARVCSKLVNRGIIEKQGRGPGNLYRYKWVATMGPTKVLYGSIAQEIFDEQNKYMKTHNNKVKEISQKQDEQVVDGKVLESILQPTEVRDNHIPTEEEIRAGWDKFIYMYEDRPRLSNTLRNATLLIMNYDGNMTALFSVTNEAQKKWINEKLIGELESKFREVMGTDKVYLRVNEYIQGIKKQPECWDTINLNEIPLQVMWDNMKERGASIEDGQLTITEIKVVKTVLS